MKNDIFKEIRNLLFDHDYVTVPNFGAFIAHYQSAEFSAEKSLFVPPQRSISFNALLKQDDGLLSARISRAQHIPMEEGRRKVDEFVTNLKNELAKRKNIQFSEIGIFTLSEENNIVFTPSLQHNYFSESFGLESFYSIDNFSIETDKTSQINETSFFNEHSMEEMEIPKFVSSKGKSLKMKFLYSLPVVILGIGLMYNFWLNPTKEKVAMSSINPIDQISSFKKNVTAPEIQQKLIVGKFKDEKNAKKLYNHLVLKGFSPSFLANEAEIQIFIKVTSENHNGISDDLQQLIGQRGVLEEK